MSHRTRIGRYYHTRPKRTERPHESCEFAVLDGYSDVVAWTTTEDDAQLICTALNSAQLAINSAHRTQPEGTQP